MTFTFVVSIRKGKKSSRHVAEVEADLVETACRSIVHKVLSEGARVLYIKPPAGMNVKKMQRRKYASS